METKRRSALIYALLVAVWALVIIWQMNEHARVQQAARDELIQRAKDVSSTVATTIRLLRRWGGVVSKERVEAALTEMLRPGEWDGIAFLNDAGDIVASAGSVDLGSRTMSHAPEIWGRDSVVLMNPVSLGTNVTHDLQETNLSVIVDFPRRSETNRPPFDGGPPPERSGDLPPGPPPDRGPDPDWQNRSNNLSPMFQTNLFRGRGGGPGRMRFTRPPWWSDEEWKAIQEKQGVHSFAIVMSARKFREAGERDLWLRCMIVLLAGISVSGLALAWSNVAKTSVLQIRLVRASELNTHLREMNLAAAGLAHETRNPLNIIRGMAQMLSKNPDTQPETRDKSRAIVEEVDKVTAQLNEFINYSRPREVRRSSVSLAALANEVARALSYDLEEKKIRLEIKGDALQVEADEQLLRQALFNLVLNATQAVGAGGQIQIVTQRAGAEVSMEVRDDGPGVPATRREEIFKPYFTTNQKGTGLGLAVVQQIVLAHGWEIQCLDNEPKGARFRITHVKVA